VLLYVRSPTAAPAG